MNTPCISAYTYFDSPYFLVSSLHIVTAISTPFYVLGMYCILAKTPTVMSSVKPYLLALHLSQGIIELDLSVFSTPYALFPSYAGMGYGVLSYVGVPMAFQAIFGLSLLIYHFICILATIENRFFILCRFPSEHIWSRLRTPWLVIHIIAVWFFILPMWFFIPNQEEARQKVFRELPCLPDYIYTGNLFVLATDATYYLVIIVFLVPLFIFESTFFIIQIVLSIKKQQKIASVSKKTLQLHRLFLIGLALQLTLPLITMATAMTYDSISVIFGYHNQAMANCFLIFAGTYGLCSTIVLIVAHKPYRVAVRRMMKMSNQRNVVTVTSQKFSVQSVVP